MQGYTNSVQPLPFVYLFWVSYFVTFQMVFPAAGLSGVPFALAEDQGSANVPGGCWR